MSNRRDFLRKSLLGAAVGAAPGAFVQGAMASEFVNRKVFMSLPVSCLFTEVQIAKIRAVLTNWNLGGTGDLIPPRRPRS